MPTAATTSRVTQGNISANAFRVGIQPYLGYRTKYFTIAGSARFVSLNFNNILGDLIFGGADQVTYLHDNKSNFLIEPAITLRGGLEKIKLQVQAGYSANLTNADFRQDEAFLTVGLNFNLNKKAMATNTIGR